MSWIKDNKFVVALGGGTLLGAALLVFFGLKGATRYDEALERFVAAADEASSFEKLALYPKVANRDGKTKALADYRQSLESLQTSFEPFRPKEIKNITPQEFTNNLLAANTEIRKAFEGAGTAVPEPFFVGFEGYKTALAPAKITGILDYQLASIKSLMLTLAEAKPTALKNFYRPALPEEENQNFAPGAAAAARSFPVEITFTGPEASLRDFLTSIVAYKDKFVVVRVMRVTNDKKEPPRATDAKFDKPASEKPAAGADAFGGGFVLPGEEPAAGAPAEPAAPPAPVVDSSRMLAQVLGNEQVNVFIRLDVLQFLPSKKLP
ncbi:MAG: Amuc_1100 family pilus-like protein [Luteolibacter sp.]